MRSPGMRTTSRTTSPDASDSSAMRAWMAARSGMRANCSAAYWPCAFSHCRVAGFCRSSRLRYGSFTATPCSVSAVSPIGAAGGPARPKPALSKAPPSTASRSNLMACLPEVMGGDANRRAARAGMVGAAHAAQRVGDGHREAPRARARPRCRALAPRSRHGSSRSRRRSGCRGCRSPCRIRAPRAVAAPGPRAARRRRSSPPRVRGRKVRDGSSDGCARRRTAHSRPPDYRRAAGRRSP